jgi:type I restriction enzyme M protein
MPSNVFATTGTNVSVLFFDNSRTTKKVVLIDASKLGEKYKDGRNKKLRLRDFEIDKIVSAFLKKKAIEGFSVTVTYKEIKEKKYSLSAGQYFEIKIKYSEISPKEFHQVVAEHSRKLTEYFTEEKILEKEILSNLNKLKFEKLKLEQE